MFFTRTCLAVGALLLGATQVYAQGDVARGKASFAPCAVCHSIEKADNGRGPSLFGVYGRAAASVEGYRYSSALKASGLQWDDANLSLWLKSPTTLVPGTVMRFFGMSDEGAREDMISYLKTLK